MTEMSAEEVAPCPHTYVENVGGWCCADCGEDVEAPADEYEFREPIDADWDTEWERD